MKRLLGGPLPLRAVGRCAGRAVALIGGLSRRLPRELRSVSSAGTTDTLRLLVGCGCASLGLCTLLVSLFAALLISHGEPFGDNLGWLLGYLTAMGVVGTVLYFAIPPAARSRVAPVDVGLLLRFLLFVLVCSAGVFIGSGLAIWPFHDPVTGLDVGVRGPIVALGLLSLGGGLVIISPPGPLRRRMRSLSAGSRRSAAVRRAAPMDLTERVLLAIVITAAFYATVACIVVAALALGRYFIDDAQLQVTRETRFIEAGGCFLGAAFILLICLPWPVPLDVRGHEVERDSQPRLHHLVKEVADAVGQAEPARTLVTAEVNAAVLQSGGVLGFGGQRVLLLGLPLLTLLTQRELMAVLVHEFGHYERRDVLFGRWIHVMRDTVLRAVVFVNSDGFVSKTLLALPRAVASLPVLIYAQLFYRATAAIARQQEFVADAIAARYVGVDAITSALLKVEGAQEAFRTYWRKIVLPALADGLRPSMTLGFQGYVASGEGFAIASRAMRLERGERRRGPHSSHPSLAERLARLRSLGTEDSVTPMDVHNGGAPAMDLLKDLPGLEDAVLAAGESVTT